MLTAKDRSGQIDELWRKLQACSESIRQKCTEAQIELRFLAEYDFHDAAKCDAFCGTSNAFCPTINVQLGKSQLGTSSRRVPEVRLTAIETATLADVWSDWKHGRDGYPSVEEVEQVFGKRCWVGPDPAVARQRALWSKIVREMEFHLKQGRKLSEILVAGDIILVKSGGIEGLARAIQANQDAGLPTLFDPNLQSSDTEFF